MRRVRNYIIEIGGKFCCGKPYGGIRTATYKTALDYVPSSQIFGLLLATYLHKTSEGRSLRTSIYMVDILREVSRSILDCFRGDVDGLCRIWPAYPRHVNPIPIFDELIRLLRTSNTCAEIIEYVEYLRDIVSGTRYLSIIVPGPRSIVPVESLVDGDGVGEFHKLHMPLCLAICPSIFSTIISIIGRAHGKDVVDRIRKRFEHGKPVKVGKLGICIDRYRHTSRYGLFYVYESLVTGSITMCSLVENLNIRGLTIQDIMTGTRYLGIGFKKNLEGEVQPLVTLFRTETGLLQTLLDIARRALEVSITLFRECRFLLGFTCLDRTVLTFLDPDIFTTGDTVSAIFPDEPGIYLQLTNRFYMVKHDGRDVGFAQRFSSIGTVADYDECRRLLSPSNGEGIVGRYLEKIRSILNLQVYSIDYLSDNVPEAVRELVLAKVGVCHTGVIPIIWTTSIR